MKHRHIVDFPSTLMFALLVTVLALVLPLIAYARYHASRHISPIPDQAVKPEIDASPSGIESESPRTAHIMADPATEPNDDRMQLALRGDRAVQPQLPATQNPIQRPVPAVLPVDDTTTDITPLERLASNGFEQR
jgi:hypothetical protein